MSQAWREPLGASLAPTLGGIGRRRLASRSEGFTLIEVVLAMGILVLGLSSLLGLFTFGAALSRQAGLRATSAAAMDGILGELEGNLFPLLPDGTVGEAVPVVRRPVPGADGAVYSATAVPLEDGPRNRAGDPLEYRVDVTLSWTNQGVQRNTAFTTILLREIPFGELMRRQLKGAR